MYITNLTAPTNLQELVDVKLFKSSQSSTVHSRGAPLRQNTTPPPLRPPVPLQHQPSFHPSLPEWCTSGPLTPLATAGPDLLCR